MHLHRVRGSAIVFRQSYLLLVRQLARDAAHTNIDVVGKIAVRDPSP
jgi:hypothetical protein